MNIKNLRMLRTLSGDGHQKTMVAYLGWEADGKDYTVEVRCGEQEEDLLEALEQCVCEMLKFIAASK